MKRAIIILVAVVGLAVGGLYGVRAWREAVLQRQEQRAFAKAQERLQAGAVSEALALAQTQARPGSTLGWPKLELEALVALRDLPRLVQAYERESPRILLNEEASLLVARAFLHSRKPSDTERVRKAWRGRETRPELWLIFDSDALVLAGKNKEAEALLRAHPQAGKADTARLARLAILVAKRDLPQAWQLLGQAAALDPHDADLRLFRGQVMESAGQLEAARFEYVAALVCRTNDAFMRDELAEFYRRQGNFSLALQTWTEAMPGRAPDYFWLKASFWSRMVEPVKLDAESVPAGDLQPLCQWLTGLPADRFFDTNGFSLLAESRRYEGERQEVFWLELTDLLQRGQEKAALERLSFNRFRPNSWNPDLEGALVRILYYRVKRSLNPTTPYIAASTSTNLHQFLAQIETAAHDERAGRKTFAPPELDAFLRGPDAVAAAFMAVGWREAALLLHSSGHGDAAHPTWFSYGLAQLLRANRTPQAALDFLARQKPDPQLELLTGETLIQTGKTPDGLARLRPLATAATAVGQRAAYILALDAFDHGQFDAARRQVNAQPLLARDVLGQELLARLSMREGDEASAARIYGAIAADSIEAKSYLARRAFAGKDWPTARRYTTELMALMPDQLQLRQNLLAIDQAEGRR